MAEPAITFGAAQSFGAQTDWSEQSSSSNVVSDVAKALNNIGNQVASKVHNARTEVSTPYTANKNGNCAAPTVLGKLVNSLVLTGIEIATSATAHATMTLTGHNHADNAHADTLQQVTHGLASAVTGFGATDFLGGTAGSAADVESGSISITCEHTDIVASDGDHLVGNNYNATVSATTVWNGVPSATVGAGWDVESVSTETTNTGFLKTTVTATKALTLA
jgi:hypothetical protein